MEVVVFLALWQPLFRALLTLAPLPCGSTLYVVQVDMKWYASRESTIQHHIYAVQNFSRICLRELFAE